jgi:hypothetical protein
MPGIGGLSTAAPQDTDQTSPVRVQPGSPDRDVRVDLACVYTFRQMSRLTILLVRTSVHRADALHLLSNLCQSEKEPSGSGSGEVEHEREDEDDCPGPDGIHDQVAGLPPFEAGEGHAATQEAEEQPG